MMDPTHLHVAGQREPHAHPHPRRDDRTSTTVRLDEARATRLDQLWMRLRSQPATRRLSKNQLLTYCIDQLFATAEEDDLPSALEEWLHDKRP